MKIGDRIRINTLEDEEYYGQCGSIVAFSEGNSPYIIHLDQNDGIDFLDIKKRQWYLDERRIIEMSQERKETIINLYWLLQLKKEEIILIESREKVNLKIKLPKI